MKLLVVVLLAFTLCLAQDPSFDHQTATYTAKFQPQVVKNAQLSLTSFWSPDNSINVETKLVESAQSTIDIFTPGWDSWSGCTNFTGPLGCPVGYLRSNEAFPIFQALLNAIHNGVTVRILTNYYNQADKPGLIDPLSFLTLAGASTRYYTTTTFLHAKYMSVDGTKVAISSVNFDYTSFMENREAGIVVEGSGASSLVSFTKQVFDADFAQGVPYPTLTYGASDMAIIKNTAPVPVVIPPPRHYSGAYVTTVTTTSQVYSSASITASPDFAFNSITSALNATSSTLGLYVYQITGDMCSVLLGLISKGITTKILVSNYIYSKSDWELAEQCYRSIHATGTTIRLTAHNTYKFSHQKYWIIDGRTVWLSTGNWSPTDYPSGSNTFPPYSSGGWRDTNRDFTIQATSSALVAVYQNVLDQDYQRGYNWRPSLIMTEN